MLTSLMFFAMISRDTEKHISARSEAAYCEEKIHFSETDVKAFIELGKTLKKVHTRLAMEGYVIQQGKIYKP